MIEPPPPASKRPSARASSPSSPRASRLSAREILDGGSGPGERAPSGSSQGAPRAHGPRSRKELALVWGKRLAVLGAVGALGAGIAGLVTLRHFEAELPKVSDLKGNYHPPQVTRVLARDGSTLAELFTERRTVVSIAALPAHVKLAVLAAEDAGFYEHEGLNYWGMLRALVVNLRAGRTRQGGSTITQQVVKNVLLHDPERTYDRKVREVLLARRLEAELSKDEILELYLNHINFGHGRYGIEEAARYNFGKSAHDLTIAEAALLAGLPAGPQRFSPKDHLDRALVRRTFVLGQMHEKGFLNDAQYDAAKDEPVRLAASSEVSGELAPEAVEVARRMLHELAGEKAALGGYTITTTIDPRLEAAARKGVRDALGLFDKRHGLTGPMKTPAPPSPSASRGKRPPPPPKDAPFEGTPSFESHRIYTGVVTAADDAASTFDVRVGTIEGSVKLKDFERYNPQGAAASVFAPTGAHVRVSLLAPLPDGTVAQPTIAKVPLRMEAGPEGALVAVDVRSRQVLALVGNYEAASGGLDRATQSRRQPGSTFKPIVYSYAIHSRRYTPSTLVDVNPQTFAGNYRPSNYEGWTGHDPLRLREALANSVNVVAVRVLDDVGPANVVPWAQSLGIRSTLKPDLSLALGSYEVSPMELCGAYATFAAGGTYEEPRLVTRIVGPDGKDLELPPLPPPRRVLDEAESYVTTSMLTSVIDHGTGVRARELKRPLAGKTGTSNQAKDTWFSGYSTEIAATVWVGYDDGRPLGGVETGGSTALPAWVEFMKVAHEHKPPTEFPRPEGVVTVTIDKKTGRLPYEGDPDTMEEVFLAGTEPTDIGDPFAVDAGGVVTAGADGGVP